MAEARVGSAVGSRSLTGRSASFSHRASVAQLAARWIHSPEVGRSKLPGGTFGTGEGNSGTDRVVTVRVFTIVRGISSIGRVRRSQRRGTGIETPILHFWTTWRFHSLVVRTLGCDPSNPSSNLGGGILLAALSTRSTVGLVGYDARLTRERSRVRASDCVLSATVV